jgi:hypothetical protein
VTLDYRRRIELVVTPEFVRWVQEGVLKFDVFAAQKSERAPPPPPQPLLQHGASSGRMGGADADDSSLNLLELLLASKHGEQSSQSQAAAGTHGLMRPIIWWNNFKSSCHFPPPLKKEKFRVG